MTATTICRQEAGAAWRWRSLRAGGRRAAKSAQAGRLAFAIKRHRRASRQRRKRLRGELPPIDDRRLCLGGADLIDTPCRAIFAVSYRLDPPSTDDDTLASQEVYAKPLAGNLAAAIGQPFERFAEISVARRHADDLFGRKAAPRQTFQDAAQLGFLRIFGAHGVDIAQARPGW